MTDSSGTSFLHGIKIRESGEIEALQLEMESLQREQVKHQEEAKELVLDINGFMISNRELTEEVLYLRQQIDLHLAQIEQRDVTIESIQADCDEWRRRAIEVRGEYRFYTGSPDTYTWED